MNSVWRELGIMLLIILAAGALSQVSWTIFNLLRQQVAQRTNTELDDVIIGAVQVPVRLWIVVWGIQWGIEQLSIIPEGWSEDIGRVFFAVYYVVVYLFLYRLIGGVITWYGREIVHRTETDLDDRFLILFRRIALIILTTVVIIIVLGRYGIEVSGLVTTLGIGSLAVALAAQETLGDMISGFTIMVDQPFKIGDRVEIMAIDTWGDVVDIGLRSTRILTRDNRMISVPNSVIGKGLVVNYSDPNTKYRVETHIGITYGADVERARVVMITAIQTQDWVMQTERIEALLLEFTDVAMVFRVRCWIEHFVETRRIIDKMNTALYYALKEAGIGMARPQRDVRLTSSVVLEKGNGVE